MARRSLTHVGGATETWGDRSSVRALEASLAVESAEGGAAAEEAARAHVHGFHTYPARIHPDTAARLVAAFTPPGGTALDPFCGSGTVLVEAKLANRDAIGTDLNPLAILLAKVKTAPMSDVEAEAILAEATRIAEFADARRKARAGASRRLPPEDVATFDPHVLLELDSVRTALSEVEPGPVHDALSLVLGALLVKVSKQRGDTAGPRRARRDGEPADAPKRIASGFVARFFVKKAEDLVTRRRAFARALAEAGATGRRVRVSEDDATELRTVGASTVDSIVTSPPYAATYDYLEHHALRLRWLGLDSGRLAKNELGSRRAYARLEPDAARDEWRRELTRFLKAAARVARPEARVVLVMADSAIRSRTGGVALRADELVGDAIERLPFEPIARASQPRPHFHGPTAAAFAKRARHEHALLLQRVRG